MSDGYLPGDAVRIRVAVADIDGAPADPGVVLRVKQGGVVTPYTYGTDAEIVRDSAGNYHADIELTAAGQFAYRWELSAPNTGAAEGVINVQKSRVI